MEIANAFDVVMAYQHISGWHRSPETDDTILKECIHVGNVNCLEVTEGIRELDNLGHQIEAIRKLKKKLPPNSPLDIKPIAFQDAVSHILSSTNQKKALLLYLHNSRDNFSQNFGSFIHKEQIMDLLKDHFLIIGWDTEDQCHHTALVQALEHYGDLSFLSDYITERKGAAVCLLPENNELCLFFCLNGNVLYQDIVRHLENARHALYIQRTEHNPSGSLEIEAIKSLQRKLPSDVSVTFRHCTLDDAIDFICKSSFDERKSLLLYLHNSELPFSRMFSQNLKNGELPHVLNSNFLVLGWDVENPEYHKALLSALEPHIDLKPISHLIVNRVAIALCIIPVNGTINLFKCLRGEITLQDTIKSLKNTQEAFSMAITNEKELQSIERDKSNKDDLGSEKLHSIWADMLGNRDYDAFEFDQHKQLKEKIGYGLKGPPQESTGYDQETLKQVDKLYEVIKTESGVNLNAPRSSLKRREKKPIKAKKLEDLMKVLIYIPEEEETFFEQFKEWPTTNRDYDSD